MNESINIHIFEKINFEQDSNLLLKKDFLSAICRY